MKNTEIISKIFKEVVDFSIKKNPSYLIKSLIDCLNHAFYHLEGKNDCEFFFNLLKENRDFFIKASNFSGDFFENPVYDHINFLYMKIRISKESGYNKIYKESKGIKNFYETEFNDRLKMAQIHEIQKTTINLSTSPMFTRKNPLEDEAYWNPTIGDWMSPWLFLE